MPHLDGDVVLKSKPGPYDTAEWTVQVQGALTVVKASGPCMVWSKKKKRSAIKGFTPQARLRMLKASAKVNWFMAGDSLFITLTYPDTCLVMTYKERSKHRYLFHRYLEEWCGRRVAAVWRIEWKPRRSGRFKGYLCPHLHLMVIGVTYIPWRLVRQWWRNAIHATGVLKTWVSKITGPEGAAKYIAKYVSKVASLDIVAYHNSRVTHGRTWGLLRTKQIPRYPVTLFRTLTPGEIDFIKGLRKWIPPKEVHWREAGFTIFGRDVAEEVQRILGTTLADGEIPM